MFYFGLVRCHILRPLPCLLSLCLQGHWPAPAQRGCVSTACERSFWYQGCCVPKALGPLGKEDAQPRVYTCLGWGEVFLDFGCLGLFLTILQSFSVVFIAGVINYSSISNGGKGHVWPGTLRKVFLWGCGGCGPLVAELPWSLGPGGSFLWAAAGHGPGKATALPAWLISDLSSCPAFTDVWQESGAGMLGKGLVLPNFRQNS